MPTEKVSDLDKKLEKYVLNVYASALLKDSLSTAAYKAVYGSVPLTPNEADQLSDSVRSFAREIKQAFIDDGWLRSIDVSLPASGPYTPEPRMTGQEWYDKYRTEWNMIVASGDVSMNSHIEAAKKTAGIE